MPKDLLGAYLREQRLSARLSVRQLSELAGISNPYLSQIERGLKRPSAEILQQIAKGLSISAETLYVQAGLLDPMDAEVVLERPDSFVPMYLGPSGWVGLEIADLDDGEIRELLVDSFRSTASARLIVVC